jgi:hypothetical protein
MMIIDVEKIARDIGGEFVSPPMRAVKSVSMTFEQLQSYTNEIIEMCAKEIDVEVDDSYTNKIVGITVFKLRNLKEQTKGK